MDLRKWDQFGALDSLIKDFTYGLKIRRIKVIDRERKIVYSTEYDLIGKTESGNPSVEESLNGKDVTVIRSETDSAVWRSNWVAETYYPLREITGNYWMLGNIYGVIQISQDVSDQYHAVQRFVIVLIIVAVVLMAFLFMMLILIVRRGERILLERADEQKRLEEQLQQSEKLASIGQMVATIAHEIRNPLGIVRSSAEMMLKKFGSESPRIGKLAGVIFEESTRLNGILTDFLNFAKPKVPFLRPLDIQEVIQRVKINLEEEIETKGIKWTDSMVDGSSPMVMGDGDLLYQAFFNIAINAFEAMQGGGSLDVTVSSSDSRVRIDFADSGSGIVKEDMSRIFTPFFTTHEMGTGLGLSIVHGIVNSHGGELTVASDVGEGAVFSVFLPLSQESES